MANAEIGSGYITIYPKSDKNFGKKAGEDLGESMSGGVSAKAVAIGNILSDVAKKAAGFAVDGIKSVIGGAMSNFAEYEQLVGGVDTLFKESSATVQEYAQNAFATAGMSANQYMETVTSFSASLLQSVGNDTAKAAEYANVAVTDMSDNANKMGSNMEDIQNAYQGFAKQNYTMLDNLKLGYGGTKGEMERLIEDANKLRAAQGENADLTIESYADIVEAIHTVQKSMDISGYSVDELNQKLSDMSLTTEEVQKVADDMGMSYDEVMQKMQEGTLTTQDAQSLLGTTAREAATTIEGSVNSMKSAWDNWLTSLATDDVDFDEKTQQLVDSIITVGQNVIPRLGEVASAIIENLPTIMTSISEALPAMGAPIAEAARNLLSTAFGDAGTGAVDALVGAFTFVGETVVPAVENIASAIEPVVSGIVQFFSDNAPTIADIISGVVDTITEVVHTLEPIMPFIGEIFGNILTVVQTVWPLISNNIQTAVRIIVAVIQGISSIVSGVRSTFESIRNAIANPIETAKNTIKGIVDTIKGFFSNFKIELPHIKLPHFAINPPGWQIGDLLEGKIPSLGIDWYAKGGFVDGATLIGAGERGPEMILPRRGGLMDEFALEVASKSNDEKVIDWLERRLGPVIGAYAPVATPREFARMVRSV